MATPDKENRLHQIESQLTPKEWAIRYALDIRKYPNNQEYSMAEAKATNGEGTIFAKAYNSLSKQVEERYPGGKPEAIEARYRLGRRLCSECEALFMAIIQINERIANDVDKFILRGRSQFFSLRYVLDSLEEPHPLFTVEEWVNETTSLSADIFAYQSAVKDIQDKYFDTFPILAIDTEANMQNAEEIARLLIVQHQNYATLRGSPKGSKEINIEEIKSRATQEQAPPLACEWMKIPKAEALLGRVDPNDVKRYTWQCYQEMVGVRLAEK